MNKLKTIAFSMLLVAVMLASPAMAVNGTSIVKTMSETDAYLGDNITVTLDVDYGLTGQIVKDTLPDELGYITGTFCGVRGNTVSSY